MKKSMIIILFCSLLIFRINCKLANLENMLTLLQDDPTTTWDSVKKVLRVYTFKVKIVGFLNISTKKNFLIFSAGHFERQSGELSVQVPCSAKGVHHIASSQELNPELLSSVPNRAH
jgi:hypothetical protein